MMHNAASAALDTITGLPGNCLVPKPTRRWISHSAPAVDLVEALCDSGGIMATYLQGLDPVETGKPCGNAWDMRYCHELWLCVEVMDDQGAAPTPSAQQAEAACLLAMTQALACAAIDTANTNGMCQWFRVGGVEPLGPQGGAAGYKITFTVRTEVC
jgi:hypothetical protein